MPKPFTTKLIVNKEKRKISLLQFAQHSQHLIFMSGLQEEVVECLVAEVKPKTPCGGQNLKENVYSKKHGCHKVNTRALYQLFVLYRQN